MKTYVHGGKLGDIVFSIPAFRWLRAERYLLVRDPADPRLWYEPAVILPLLRANGVPVELATRGGVRDAEDDWVNGDRFHCGWGEEMRRRGWLGCNLVERHLMAVGAPPWEWSVPWLAAEPDRVAEVVFCRSARYRPASGEVDWRCLADWAAGRSIFLGTRAEHSAFEEEFSTAVPFYLTNDLQAAARVIAGARVTVANQTGLQAVASGLGAAHVLEVCEAMDCCRFGYAGQWFSSDEFLRCGGDWARVDAGV